ncbi:MAG: TrmH family RNA methyltransferase, partial [Gemmatimonadaceae bacterium]
RQTRFVAEGVRAVEELLRSPVHLVGALVAPSLVDTQRGAAVRESIRASGVPVLEVGDREFASAASTESPQGVLVVADIPERDVSQLTLGDGSRLLLLDAVQDPGNVGTLVRTAAALGVTATLAMPETVDLWNAKVVRSAMGALFRHSVIACTWQEFDAVRAAHHLSCWAADSSGEPIDRIESAGAIALVVGNEGAGISTEAQRRADRRIAIPIAPDVESLNVAVAAGILLYQLRA